LDILVFFEGIDAENEPIPPERKKILIIVANCLREEGISLGIEVIINQDFGSETCDLKFLGFDKLFIPACRFLAVF
jgi:hypothetical protein